jgi:hypothetical protein
MTGIGFFGGVTWSISPALPTGLSINSSTGVISGTPTVSSATTTYTITGTSGTQTGTATISITVAAASGAVIDTASLGGFFSAFATGGSGEAPGIDIIFKTNGTVQYKYVWFPFGNQLSATWLTSGVASTVSIRATNTGNTVQQPNATTPSGSTISGNTGWIAMTSDATIAGVQCGAFGNNAVWSQEYNIEFSTDGGATTLTSYLVTIGGEVSV